jgi:3,4-dihydroxy-2-butanone 4-phosphate synthase
VAAAVVAEKVAAATEELRHGRPVVLVDDLGRGGVGDIVFAAEFADADAVNLMIREAGGLVSVALPYGRCAELCLGPIGDGAELSSGGVPMVSIEAREGITTGISAADRARTIAVAADPASGPLDLVTPGHVMPLRARPGGLIERQSRVEASLYVTRAAGLRPAAALCEVVDRDGSLPTGAELEEWAAAHGVRTVPISAVYADCLERHGSPLLADQAEAGRQMRDVMGHFATGVAVITADGEAGPVGTTVNAITSVSLKPPLLLVCLAEDSETLAALRERGSFAVNLLTAEQRHHSDRFAIKGAASGAGEVEFGRHEIGLPFLPEALATIACGVEAIHPGGDHQIVVGEARAIWHGAPPAEPLLFYRGGYGRLHGAGVAADG